MTTISAKIIKDSINLSGFRITTLELEYPRFIHSEFMTHRDFSRNAASSRAIPIKRMIDLILKNMASPIHWGANQAGMQAKSELIGLKLYLAKTLWETAGYFITIIAYLMEKVGVHKQITNRILEPWSHIKVVLTSTKFQNWENLRLHPDAQPEIYELAKQIKKAMNESTPQKLNWGEWHLPYVEQEDLKLPLETQKEISASACAQVSYRNLDTSVDKAQKIYSMLINADVIHASPFEHVAQAASGTGNFTGTGWRQLRKDIEETYEK